MVINIQLLSQLIKNNSENRWFYIQKRHFLVSSLAILPCMAYIWARDPSEQGFAPPCIFFTLTGLHCPGCGTLRSLHQLFNGNVSAAFGLNPLIFLSVPFIACALLVMGSKSSRPKFLASALHRNIQVSLCLAVVIAYWVLRNTNIEPFAFSSFWKWPCLNLTSE